MSRNVSSVVDDEVADFIEKERMKRGVLKSKAINVLLKEKMEKSDTNNINKIKEVDGLNVNLGNEGKENEKKNNSDSKLIETIPIEPSKPEIKIPELIIQPKEPIKQEGTSSIPIPDLSNIPTNKFIILKDKPIEQKSEIKPKLEVKRKMSGEIQNSPDLEKVFRKLREQEELNKTFKEIHNTVSSINDRVCKDGECTKNELSSIRKDLSSLEELKKNQTHHNSELSEVKTKLTKLDELDNLKKGLNELKEEIDNKEICPGCNYDKVPNLASYCPECGKEFHAWADKDGKKVENWKPYSQRIGKK